MSADRAILDRETGEVLQRDEKDVRIELLEEELAAFEADRTPEAREIIKELRFKVAACERDLRKGRAALQRLERNHEAERKTYIRRPVIEDLFVLWQTLRNHPRSKLTPERFDACKARLEEGYTELDGAMALHGQAAKPPVKDGVVYDDFEIVFRSGSNLERYCNMCPREKRAELRAEMADGQTEIDTEAA